MWGRSYILSQQPHFFISAVERAMQPILDSLLDQAGKLNEKATSTIPRPKIPDNDIEPSGHNSTRPNEALFINIIPEGTHSMFIKL